MDKQADIMIICAHPDDAEFAAAGTIAKWVKAGKSAAYLICSDGEKGTSDYSISPRDLARTRQKEQQAAAEALGAKDVAFLHFPDQGLEDTSALRKEVVRWIRTYRPDTVLCPDPYRKYIWHRDHRIAGIVALDAVYPYARDHLAYPDLIKEGFEPHKVKQVYCWAPEENINFVSDITETFENKLAALRCHVSQVAAEWMMTEEWVRQMARDSAKGQAFKLAEAFHHVEIEM